MCASGEWAVSPVWVELNLPQAYLEFINQSSDWIDPVRTVPTSGVKPEAPSDDSSEPSSRFDVCARVSEWGSGRGVEGERCVYRSEWGSGGRAMCVSE